MRRGDLMFKENNATILFNLLYDFKNKLKGILTGDKDCGMISVLRFLYEKGQGFANQISKDLSISRARLSSIIKKLQKKDFVNVKLDEFDKRKMMLNLTENGFQYIVNLEEKRIRTNINTPAKNHTFQFKAVPMLRINNIPKRTYGSCIKNQKSLTRPIQPTYNTPTNKDVNTGAFCKALLRNG